MESTIDKELAELEQKIQQENSKPKEETPLPEPVIPEPSPEPNTSVNQDDVPELAQKKGWKSAEEALKSYESLEKKFHEQNQEVARLKAQPPVDPYLPPSGYGYQPPPSYQPQYAPPPNPYAPASYEQRISEEQMAASYNLSVEDFRKVVALNRDMIEAVNRRHQVEMNQRLDQISRQNEKSSDMAEVSGDPAFHNPGVQQEMHEILSKNPALFTQRRPYSTAFNQALANIGRKNAMGSTTNPSTLPTDPPKGVGGSATSFSGKKNGVGLTMAEANKLTPEQLEKQLRGMGAFKTYEDLAG